MKALFPDQVSSRLRSFFHLGMPVGLRCLAVLNGDTIGSILTDDPQEPTYAIVLEPGDHTLFLGGTLAVSTIAEVVNLFRRNHEVVLDLWDGDPLLARLPPNPDYEGRAIDFAERTTAVDLAAYSGLPAGCSLKPLDRRLFDRTRGLEWYLRLYGSKQQALGKGMGLCLVRGEEIVCEAFAGPSAEGVIEMGVETAPAYYGKGYATVTCAHLIRACEARGYRTFWNTAKQNAASVALARKLGYQKEEESWVLAWWKATE
jgi:GNAT superfamily N-acetyltransferase